MQDNTSPVSVSKPRPTERNPETARRFKRQAWWQVTFPVVAVAVLLVGGAVVLLVIGGAGSVSVVADYSLGLLVLLGMIGGLLVLGLMGALVYGVSRLIGAIPPYTYAVQQFMRRVYEWVDRTTDRLARVVIVARSTLAGVVTYLRQQGMMPDEKAPSSPEPAPESRQTG